MSNLNDLNKILFETLHAVKNGEMPLDRASTLCNVSSSIIDNAKVQLNAAKLMKGSSLESEFFGLLEAPKNNLGVGVSHQSLYDKKLEFAMSLEYDSLASAIGDMGKNKFEQAFKDFNKG